MRPGLRRLLGCASGLAFLAGSCWMGSPPFIVGSTIYLIIAASDYWETKG